MNEIAMLIKSVILFCQATFDFLVHIVGVLGSCWFEATDYWLPVVVIWYVLVVIRRLREGHPYPFVVTGNVQPVTIVNPQWRRRSK